MGVITFLHQIENKRHENHFRFWEMEQNVNEGVSGLKVYSSKLDPNAYDQQSLSANIDSISGTISFAFDIYYGSFGIRQYSHAFLLKTLKLRNIERNCHCHEPRRWSHMRRYFPLHRSACERWSNWFLWCPNITRNHPSYSVVGKNFCLRYNVVSEQNKKQIL